MSEHRNQKDEVELFIFIFKRRCKLVDVELCEGEFFATPADEFFVVVGAKQVCVCSSSEVSDYPAASTTQIENVLKVFNIQGAVFQHSIDFFGSTLAHSEILFRPSSGDDFVNMARRRYRISIGSAKQPVLDLFLESVPAAMLEHVIIASGKIV